jgi:hypothetical protein
VGGVALRYRLSIYGKKGKERVQDGNAVMLVLG